MAHTHLTHLLPSWGQVLKWQVLTLAHSNGPHTIRQPNHNNLHRARTNIQLAYLHTRILTAVSRDLRQPSGLPPLLGVVAVAAVAEGGTVTGWIFCLAPPPLRQPRPRPRRQAVLYPLHRRGRPPLGREGTGAWEATHAPGV